MTIYTTRGANHVFAVKIGAGGLLIVEGDMLVVDLDAATATSFNQQQFDFMFTALGAEQLTGHTALVTDTTRPVRRKATAKKKPSGERQNRDPDKVLTTQPGRIFYYLRSIGRPATVTDIHSVIPHVADQKANSVSAALTELSYQGFVTSVHTDGIKARFWSTTPKGDAKFDAIGPQCFTKYDMQVPPDNRSPAQMVAAAINPKRTA